MLSTARQLPLALPLVSADRLPPLLPKLQTGETSPFGHLPVESTAPAGPKMKKAAPSEAKKVHGSKVKSTANKIKITQSGNTRKKMNSSQAQEQHSSLPVDSTAPADSQMAKAELSIVKHPPLERLPTPTPRGEVCFGACHSQRNQLIQTIILLEGIQEHSQRAGNRHNSLINHYSLATGMGSEWTQHQQAREQYVN